MASFRKKYAPGYCQYSSRYDEIRWDVVGCNLGCHFCWSPASRTNITRESSANKSPEDILVDTLQSINNPRSTFIRFTGGEPTLYWEDILHALHLCEADKIISEIPILIQTNGIKIGNGSIMVDELARFSKQLFLFELSFKGTNEREFSLPTGKDSSLYAFQLRAYKLLSNISQGNHNIKVVAVLGIYHSSTTGKSKFVFVEPSSGNVLFDRPEEWDPDFRSIWKSADLKWVEPLRRSPLGVWENINRRCGSQGVGILRHYPSGIVTNSASIFPMKPRSYEYARLLAKRIFWL